MNLDMLTLQCFLAIADAGSLTKAAKQIGRTQSAVSQQLTKLESDLGQKLFKRAKPLELTPYGEIFQGYARKILNLHYEMTDRFKDPDLEGELKFGLPEDFASVLLSEVLVEFMRAHPRVMLHIECDLTLNLYERFKKKDFDLVLVKMSRPEDFPNGLEVWSENLEWVGNKRLLDKKNLPKPLPLILSPQPCVYRSRALEALEEAHIPWQCVFSSPSYSGTVAAVKAGMGLTVLPKKMIPHSLEVMNHLGLPALPDTHISMLKHDSHNFVLNSFEEYVIDKLLHN
jgi:DNA-binding transcriptional LysR family regulator